MAHKHMEKYSTSPISEEILIKVSERFSPPSLAKI